MPPIIPFIVAVAPVPGANIDQKSKRVLIVLHPLLKYIYFTLDRDFFQSAEILLRQSFVMFKPESTAKRIDFGYSDKTPATGGCIDLQRRRGPDFVFGATGALPVI